VGFSSAAGAWPPPARASAESPEVPHGHRHPSAALVPVTPAFTIAERLAVAGFLAGYSGLTRQACELDLRQYAAWCRAHGLALFAARRAGIEGFARDLEARGRWSFCAASRRARILTSGDARVPTRMAR
jgi:hypothetical protein